MKKIHRVSYGDLFSRDFRTSKLDHRLEDLELDEKLMIIDNVIDYLQENFKELSPSKKRPEKESSPKRHSSMGADQNRDEAAHGDESTTDIEQV